MPFTWYPLDQDKTVAESSDEGSGVRLDQQDQALRKEFVVEENNKSTPVDVFPGHHQDIPEDIPEEVQTNGTVSAPPVKPPKKSKKHQIETPTPLPPPPPWKIILETTVNTGIDSLFKVKLQLTNKLRFKKHHFKKNNKNAFFKWPERHLQRLRRDYQRSGFLT